MARKKVKLAWIQKNNARRASFKKRLGGLLKKMGEISTLCDVKSCAIIYNPEDTQPEVWPSIHEARDLIQSFLQLPEISRYKRMMNQQSFLELKEKKMNKKYQKLQLEHSDLELGASTYQYLCGRDINELSPEDAASLSKFVNMKLETMNNQIKAAMDKEGSSSRNPNLEVGQHQSPNFFMDDGASYVIRTVNGQMMFQQTFK